MRGFFAILDNLRSAHNVGSIMRTADAVGLEKLYLCGITPTPSKVKREWSIHTQKAIQKTALGAEKTTSWEYYPQTWRLIEKLKQEKIKIIAVERTKKSLPYFQWQPKLPLALVFGNEKRGLSEKILQRADLIIEIPMLGKKESLNVSISFAIISYYILQNVSKNYRLKNFIE